MATWIVRGGSRRGLYEEGFLQSCTIGIFFGADWDLTNVDDGTLRRNIHQFYVRVLADEGKSFPSSSVKGTVTKFLNQVILFRDVIQPGDTVIMPRKATGGRMVAVGTVEGDYEHWEEEFYPHRRSVRWLEESVPKEQTGLDWYASDQRTVFKIGD